MIQVDSMAQLMAEIADIGLKSSVWLGLALLLLWVMHRETARARHRVCLIALCGLPFLPLLHFLPSIWKIPVGIVPVRLVSLVNAAQSAVPVKQTLFYSGGQSMPLAVGRVADEKIDTKKIAIEKKTSALTNDASIHLQGAGTAKVSGSAPIASLFNIAKSNISASNTSPSHILRSDNPTRHNQSLSSVTGIVSLGMVSLWLVGFAYVMLRNLLSWRALNRLQRDSALVPTGCLADALTNAARTYEGRSSKRGMTLRIGGQTPGFAAPMTWGWLRPVVWLPESAMDWTPERVRVVLLHETAHIHRSDWLAQTITACVCAVYWFHPLVWILARRLHVESERACDDCVLQTGVVPAASYAQHLLDVARTLKSLRSAPIAAVTMARSSHIETRLRAILATQPIANTRWARTRARIAALALPVTLVPLSSTQLTASEPKSKTRIATRAEAKLFVPTILVNVRPQKPQTPILPPVRQAALSLLPSTSYKSVTPLTPDNNKVKKEVKDGGWNGGIIAKNLTGKVSEDQQTGKLQENTRPQENAGLQNLPDTMSDTKVENKSERSKPAENRPAENRPAENRPAENRPAEISQLEKGKARENKAAENKAKGVVARVQELPPAAIEPADIEPEAERLMAQSAEAYGALNSLSLTIHYEITAPMSGLTHADWNVLWKNPNRAIITCKNATGTSRFLADGSNLFVFATRDTRRYARLPLKPDGTHFWPQIGENMFDAGTNGMEYFPQIMEGRTPARLFGSYLRSLKMGARDIVEGVAVQNVLAQVQYDIFSTSSMFTIRRQAPISTMLALKTFAIGIEDHLVHRITCKALTPPGKDGSRLIESTQTFADIKINPEVPDSAFAFTPPADREAEEKVADLGERNHDHHLKRGVPAPDFTARDINGKTVSLSQYRGKTVLLVFWTRDCGNTPCETDLLAAQYRKYHAQGFEVLGICSDSMTQRITLPEFLKKHTMTWPQILDGGRATGPIFRRYGVKGTTQSMLIDKNGNILNPDAIIGDYLNYQLEQIWPRVN